MAIMWLFVTATNRIHCTVIAATICMWVENCAGGGGDDGSGSSSSSNNNNNNTIFINVLVP